MPRTSNKLLVLTVSLHFSTAPRPEPQFGQGRVPSKLLVSSTAVGCCTEKEDGASTDVPLIKLVGALSANALKYQLVTKAAVI